MTCLHCKTGIYQTVAGDWFHNLGNAELVRMCKLIGVEWQHKAEPCSIS
jgi:hypothetical protein